MSASKGRRKEPDRDRARGREQKRSILGNPFWVAGIADDPSRDADDDCMIRDIAGHHRASPDHGTLAYGDARKNRGIAADRGASANARADDFPVRASLQMSLRGRRARIGIIGKHHPVPDEDLVGDLDAFANKTMRRDFTTVADDGILLDFDKRSNLGFVTDATSIEIDQILMVQNDV
jgi:hypothetical protein